MTTRWKLILSGEPGPATRARRWLRTRASSGRRRVALWRVALHLSRSRERAEDLLQETFLAAIQRAHSFDAERPLVPWLMGLLSVQARRAQTPKGCHERVVITSGATVEVKDQAEEQLLTVSLSPEVAQAFLARQKQGRK